MVPWNISAGVVLFIFDLKHRHVANIHTDDKGNVKKITNIKIIIKKPNTFSHLFLRRPRDIFTVYHTSGYPTSAHWKIYLCWLVYQKWILSHTLLVLTYYRVYHNFYILIGYFTSSIRCNRRELVKNHNFVSLRAEYHASYFSVFYLWFTILVFHAIPRETKDNRHSGHVGVPNKRNNQNSFVKSTPIWPPWRQVKTSNSKWNVTVWKSVEERRWWCSERGTTT